MKFWIRYGISREIGEWEEVTAKDEADAELQAWHKAVEEYESREGMHGLLTLEEVAEENGLEGEDAKMAYIEEREGWLEYEATDKNPEDGETHEY